MKLAISIWNGRIAPVFDVSERCLIISSEKSEFDRSIVVFPESTAEEKAGFLEANGVSTLVCGAISREYEEAFIERGIETLSFIAGPTEQVLKALKEGTLVREFFSMPGCGCPRRRCRRRGRRRSMTPSKDSEIGPYDDPQPNFQGDIRV